MPLPSGGVFAEAVLGRNNAAERLQAERFWNWQDSPIPIAAPEIAAITSGSRAQPEDAKPGQLSAPVVSIQSPVALPDPTAMAAVVTALQNANMFRDMSGLAQSAAVAQTLQQLSAAGATAAAQQAGDNLKTVMDQQTQRMRIGAALVAQLYGVPASAGGGGAGPPRDQSLTEQGGQINSARTLDESRPGGGAPQGAEADALRNQSGAKGAELARKVIEAPSFRPGYLTPQGAAAPVRGVGPKQPVPRTMTMILQLSSLLQQPGVLRHAARADRREDQRGRRQHDLASRGRRRGRDSRERCAPATRNCNSRSSTRTSWVGRGPLSSATAIPPHRSMSGLTARHWKPPSPSPSDEGSVHRRHGRAGRHGDCLCDYRRGRPRHAGASPAKGHAANRRRIRRRIHATDQRRGLPDFPPRDLRHGNHAY